MKDAESWYILGNAVLSNFFVNQKTIDDIKYALKCYNNAVIIYLINLNKIMVILPEASS